MNEKPVPPPRKKRGQIPQFQSQASIQPSHSKDQLKVLENIGEKFGIRLNDPETTVGPGVNIRGELHYDRLLRIDGRFEGKLCSNGDLLLSSSGILVGDVWKLRTVIIDGGTVIGNILADKVILMGRASVRGSISCKALTADPYVTIIGRANIHNLSPEFVDHNGEIYIPEVITPKLAALPKPPSTISNTQEPKVADGTLAVSATAAVSSSSKLNSQSSVLSHSPVPPASGENGAAEAQTLTPIPAPAAVSPSISAVELSVSQAEGVLKTKETTAATHPAAVPVSQPIAPVGTSSAETLSGEKDSSGGVKDKDPNEKDAHAEGEKDKPTKKKKTLIKAGEEKHEKHPDPSAEIAPPSGAADNPPGEEPSHAKKPKKKAAAHAEGGEATKE